MGSRTDRYRVLHGEEIAEGICTKVTALDGETGQKVMIKWSDSSTIEFRAAELADRMGIPAVVGKVDYLPILLREDNYVDEAYVLPLIDGAYEIPALSGVMSRQQELDFIMGTAFAWIIAEGDRHSGNYLVVGDRIMLIDMAYPGWSSAKLYLSRAERDRAAQAGECELHAEYTNRVTGITFRHVTETDIEQIVWKLRSHDKDFDEFVGWHNAHQTDKYMQIKNHRSRLMKLNRVLKEFVLDYGN